MKTRVIVAGLLTMLSLIVAPGSGMAQSALAADKAMLVGPWLGRWIAPEGWIYEANMSLQLADSGSVTGEINWTLRKSPRANEAGKIGLTGKEKVHGTYYASTATLILEGYEKDDPSGILGLDKYRLVISEDHRVLGGISWHHGPWTGQLILSRGQ